MEESLHLIRPPQQLRLLQQLHPPQREHRGHRGQCGRQVFRIRELSDNANSSWRDRSTSEARERDGTRRANTRRSRSERASPFVTSANTLCHDSVFILLLFSFYFTLFTVILVLQLFHSKRRVVPPIPFVSGGVGRERVGGGVVERDGWLWKVLLLVSCNWSVALEETKLKINSLVIILVCYCSQPTF